MKNDYFHQLISSLRPYQREGVLFLCNNKSALLADEMGLGKTVQTAVTIELLLKSEKIKKILIVCPKSLCFNWEKELNHWTPTSKVRIISGNFNDRKAHYRLPFNLWITSYDLVRLDIDFLYRELFFDLVILDEAQKIKNINSKIALSCRTIPRSKSWALTGTPLENRLDDLVSIFQFLKRSLINVNMSRPQIHSLIQPYYLRRKKTDVLPELPPIIIQDLTLELTENQKESYYSVFYKARESLLSKKMVSNVEIFSIITKLKQICNLDPVSQESCKIDALFDLLEEVKDSDYKIIIFSQYVQTLKFLAEKLRDYNIALYHGAMNQDKRNRIVESFENSSDPIILLMSLKAGGVGLNLPSASLIILYDRWWNPAIEDQAINRGHRFGRKGVLHVIKFLVKDTIEERIDKILAEKKDLFESYINEAKSSEIPLLIKEDLIKLFLTE